MSNIFYCLASAYRRKRWKKQTSIITYLEENEGKTPLRKGRRKRMQEENIRSSFVDTLPKGHGRQWKEWNWWWKSATQTNIPKNAIFKKAAGNQAGVLWESTNLMSALTYGNHQLRSPLHPRNTPASKELHSWGQKLQHNAMCPPKKEKPGTRGFPRLQAVTQSPAAVVHLRGPTLWWEPAKTAFL